MKMLCFPDYSSVIRRAPWSFPGAPRLVVRAPRWYQGCCHGSEACRWYSKVHPTLSLALRGIPKLISITPKVLLYQASEIPVAPKAGWNALLGSDTLLKLTHLSLHSTFSQTLLEARSDYNTFCWCCRNITISGPLNHIMKFLIPPLAIKNVINPTLFWVIDDHWVKFTRRLVWCWGFVQIEFWLLQFTVILHRLGRVHFVCIPIDGFTPSIWSHTSVIEHLRWPGHLEMLAQEPHFVSDMKCNFFPTRIRCLS